MTDPNTQFPDDIQAVLNNLESGQLQSLMTSLFDEIETHLESIGQNLERILQATSIENNEPTLPEPSI